MRTSAEQEVSADLFIPPIELHSDETHRFGAHHLLQEVRISSRSTRPPVKQQDEAGIGKAVASGSVVRDVEMSHAVLTSSSLRCASAIRPIFESRQLRRPSIAVLAR